MTEVEVTDPSHPLYGRRFPLLSLSSPLQGGGHVRLAYDQQMSLRIPLEATNLGPTRSRSQTKLTLEALTEFVTLAEQYEVLCPTNLKRSGPVCQSKFKAKSSTSSRRSSRR